MKKQAESIQDFYKGKRVLLTGHTGFKGSWMAVWLQSMGAQVTGLSLDPTSANDNFVLSSIGEKITDIRGDIRDGELVKQVCGQARPDIIFHLAAQPLVRLSYQMPVETYQTNVMGTINVLEAMRESNSAKVGVFITTDKCYENKEQIWGYRENEPMGGHDPYSSSKGAAEIAISSWRRSFFNPDQFSSHGKAIASARAGNVIGGGDWAADRIVPDCIRALEKQETISIRSPKSIRPWQFVLEPLYGYLLLAKKMWEDPVGYSEGWNFGPDADSVANVWDIATKIVDFYGEGELKDVSDPNQLHEAKLLMLDISKARYRLDWEPRFDLNEALYYTVDWYKRYRTENVYDLCREHICRFTQTL